MGVFEVDRKGLAKLLSRKGKEFVILELIQNAWDEEGVTKVEVRFEQSDGHAYIFVKDDAPEGFADLRHAYTLFAESRKKANPEQRGRFNLGEKLVIALADYVNIGTTTGTVTFANDKRTFDATTRYSAGTVVEVRMRMNRQEATALRELVTTLIPPGILTTFNGVELTAPRHITRVFASLDTEVADEVGYLRPARRRTTINVWEPRPGETPMLYEMGIPVVETDSRYHIDVGQKVPLTIDRDNVRPAFMRDVMHHVLQATANLLTTEEVADTWVTASLPKASPETLETVLTKRFGEKRVSYDPSDPEANKIAVAQGYTVVHGGTFDSATWRNIKSTEALRPAGQVTPSPKPYSPEGRPVTVISPDDWTPAMVETIDTIQDIAYRVLGRTVGVLITREFTWPFVATFGNLTLTLNLGRLGHSWFDEGNTRKGRENQIALLLHEFAHHTVSDHLSSEFADEIARLGAKLAVSYRG